MNRRRITLMLSSLFLIQCVQKDVTRNEKLVRDVASSQKTTPMFQTCGAKNSYLEKQMENISYDNFLPDSSRWDKMIPIACIQFAQKNYGGAYAYCVNENAKPKVGVPRPCLSEKYVRLVYNAYHDVMNCFNLDPRGAFLQIMIESGFHINAINKTGFDAGIGQFTKSGILRVMDREILDRTSRVLLESSNPSCQRVSSAFREIQGDAFKIEKRCSMITLPQNPYRSLVLHYLHTLRDQLDLKRLLVERPEVAELMNEKILEQLMYMAYNRGIQGTLRLLDGYVKNRRRAGTRITAEDLELWQNMASARKILRAEPHKRDILKSAVIRNLNFAEYAMIQDQNYVGLMVDAKEAVEKHLGDQCF